MALYNGLGGSEPTEYSKAELEDLIAGKTIEKPIHEDITYDSIYDSEDNLWNFLFFTGYLKQVGSRMILETLYVTMAIPNAPHDNQLYGQ